MWPLRWLNLCGKQCLKIWMIWTPLVPIHSSDWTLPILAQSCQCWGLSACTRILGWRQMTGQPENVFGRLRKLGLLLQILLSSFSSVTRLQLATHIEWKHKRPIQLKRHMKVRKTPKKRILQKKILQKRIHPGKIHLKKFPQQKPHQRRIKEMVRRGIRAGRWWCFTRRDLWLLTSVVASLSAHFIPSSRLLAPTRALYITMRHCRSTGRHNPCFFTQPNIILCYPQCHNSCSKSLQYHCCNIG